MGVIGEGEGERGFPKETNGNGNGNGNEYEYDGGVIGFAYLFSCCLEKGGIWLEEGKGGLIDM